jgi:hypothetical protein
LHCAGGDDTDSARNVSKLCKRYMQMASSDRPDTSAREEHYRLGTGALRGLRGWVFRALFALALEWTLPVAYGGTRLPCRKSRAYYIGGRLHDRNRMAAACDRLRDAVVDTVGADFGEAGPVDTGLYVAMIDDPPGLGTVAARLGLDKRYTVANNARLCYFWSERAVFAAGALDSDQSRFDLSYGYCLACLHELFGATWPLGWAVVGYAHCVAVRAAFGSDEPSESVLRHFARVVRKGDNIPLSEVLRLELPPEWPYGPYAYHETAALFVSYLRRAGKANPRLLSALRDEITAKGAERPERLQDVFGAPMTEIERRFGEWCRSEMQRIGENY